MPALLQSFVDLDVGDDMHAFIKANEVRDRIGADLIRLASTAHGGKAMIAMLVGARSAAFWLQLDLPDAYRAFHRLTEVWAVVSQANGLKSRH